jgi:hypothetical protein
VEKKPKSNWTIARRELPSRIKPERSRYRVIRIINGGPDILNNSIVAWSQLTEWDDVRVPTCGQKVSD